MLRLFAWTLALLCWLAALPAVTVIPADAPHPLLFTGKEWTGEMKSTDIHGDPIRQAEVFRIHCEPAHATDTVPYDTVERARQGAVSGDWSLSPRYRLLTGPGEEWQLTVYRNMEEAAADAAAFYKPGFTGAEERPYTGSGVVQDRAHADYGCGWRTVTLPASWQTQGFDFSIYTNITTPWKGVYGNEGANKADKDLVPAAPTVFNPVGLYRRQFEVDPAWLKEGGRVYVSFQGVESAYYLYVNGYEVGYAEDSYDAHDFDLTDYLNPNGRDNLIALRVHRWCDGSWLEDQDMLRMGGVFRDVFLYAAPPVAIRDYKVETPLHNGYTDATLSLRVQIQNKSGEEAEGYALEVLLYDGEGVPVFSAPLKETHSVPAGEEVGLSLSRELTAPRLWSDEDPYLYTLVLALYNKEGRLIHTVSQQLGVREISFTKTQVDGNYQNVTRKYQQILLNGKPLLFRGVNRHDSDPATGRYVSPALYEQDIRIMKEHNINAVRTSHYPDDRHFYRLCDKYGILVMAETNAESHALQWDSDVMASHFTALYRDRLTSNIQAQKNRACVVMWSLGNECGDTPNSNMFQRAIQEVLRPLDSTRPVHYEGLHNRGGVDVYSNMYPEVASLASRGQDGKQMPYVLCEYVFAQGNSVGNLQEYWEEIRRYDNMLGAFIWDFVDKAVETPLPLKQVLTVDKSPFAHKATLSGEIAEDRTWGRVLGEGHVTLAASDPLNAALSGRNPFTLEMTFQPLGSGEYQQLISKGDHQVSWRVYADSRLDLVLFAGGNWRLSSFRLPADWKGNWHHAAVVFNGATASMYCDGIALTPIENAPLSAPIPQGDHLLAINYDTETGRSGQNRVAHARIYSRALTKGELAAQHAADLGQGSYAIPPEDGAVRMWMDFTSFSFADHHPDADGVFDYYGTGTYFAYGGDWGEAIHDGSYLSCGLVSPDRRVQPEMQEVAYVYQPIRFEDVRVDRGQIRVINDLRFTAADKYAIRWELMCDGAVRDRGEIPCSVGPMESGTVIVPYKLPRTLPAGSEWFLNLQAVLKEEEGCLKTGQVIAREQFSLSVTSDPVPARNPAASSLAATEEPDSLTLAGSRFAVTFDKTTGMIRRYVYNGQELITGCSPNFWRAAMDSDHQSSGWRSAGASAAGSLTLDREGGGVTVTARLQMPESSSRLTYRYAVYPTGEITVAVTLSPAADSGELLKVGTEWLLPETLDQLTFYGEGPADSYADRRQGATVGVYTSTVAEEFYPYARPQACGNHTGVRWIALTGEDSPVGLAAVGQTPLEAGALPYRVRDFAGKGHPYEMAAKTGYTVLNTDMVSAGLGGANCGPGTLPKYRLYPDKTYAYAFTLIPFTKGENVMALSKPWRAATAGNPAPLAGDADGDGAITSTDARLTLQLAVNKIKEADIPQPGVTDVDGDGAITSTDARLILQNAVGKIKAFPTEGSTLQR